MRYALSMSSTESIPSPSPAKAFFRDLFSTYGWVVVLVVGVIGAFFAQVGQVGERVAKVEGRLDGIELRLTKVEGKLDALEGRVGAVERRLDVMDGKLDRLLDLATKRP